MTDSPTAPSHVDDGPVYELPDRPALDARSAAALALNAALDDQLAGQPDVVIALDPGPLTDAVLSVVGDFPRIPEWIEGEERMIGGGTHPGTDRADPVISASVPKDLPGYVALQVEGETDDGVAVRPFNSVAHVPAADAEQWALAVLGACRRTGKIPQ